MHGCRYHPPAPAAVNALSPFVTPSGSSATKLSFDPIVGIWRRTGSGHQFQIVFDVNGKTQETDSSLPHVIYNGTWIPAGDNTYLVTRDTGKNALWIHDVAANTIHKQEAASVVYSLYQGTGLSAGSPTATAGSSAVLSGTGNMVDLSPQPNPGYGYLPLPLRARVILLSGSRMTRATSLTPLANEIGVYSGTKTQSLDAGKYYLKVTASGAWTIQASVS